MKFKVSYDKSNLFFMTFLIILCFLTCIFWFTLKKYIYFGIYLSLTIIIAHMYYFTSYFIDKGKLIIKLGFIPIKINSKKINNITKLSDNKVKIELKNISFTLYPSNSEVFISNLKTKKKGKE